MKYYKIKKDKNIIAILKEEDCDLLQVICSFDRGNKNISNIDNSCMTRKEFNVLCEVWGYSIQEIEESEALLHVL